VPLEEQLLAASGEHMTHVAPLAPQVEGERVSHVAPAQHPIGQEVASQTHCSPAHSWPPAHAGPPLHVHAPSGEQVSAWLVHAVHAAPPVPQVVRDDILQVAPLQQPVHVAAQPLQTPPLQRSPTAQLVHAPPPLPHAVGWFPISHVVPAQHPEQEVESHTQP
jgi:hypothetical protein